MSGQFASNCVRQRKTGAIASEGPKGRPCPSNSLLGICLPVPNLATLLHLFHGHPFCFSEDSPTRLSQHTQG